MKMTLNTLFDFNTKGIFGYLDEYAVPWKNVVPSNLLDLDYHTAHGDKVISKTVSSLLDTTGLSDDNKQKLAHLIYVKNSVKWNKLWETIGLYDKFSVLDNTNLEETITHEHTGLDIRDLNYGKQKQTFSKGEQNNEVNQGQQSLTQGAQTNKTGSQTNNVENKTSAFNSNSYQPDNSQNQTLGQREDSVGQRVDTVGAKIDTSKDGARQDVRENDAYADKDTLDTFFKDTVSTTRHGNIGVTTSGQLIDDFRKIVDWTIFDTVFEDVNAILVLDFFGDCDSDLDDYTIETNYVLPTATANRLGGIKVGHNLTVEADGTLNAQVDAGNVQSVNGKTGVVVLTNEDVNAPSTEAFNNLAISKQDKIVTEGFENGTFYGIWNGEASFREVMQVPGYDGQKGQVLTKGDGVRYEWKDSVGGGKIYLPASKVVRWKGYVYGGSIGTVQSTSEYSFAIDLTDFIEDGYVYYLQYSPLSSKVTKERNYIRLASNSVYLPPGDDTTEWSKSIEWYENNNRSWSTYNNLYTYVLAKNKKGFYFQPGCSEPVEPGVDFMLSVWKEPSIF